MNVNKFYLYLSSIYRIGIVAIVVALDILTGFDYEKEKLVIYVIFSLYAILFSVLRVSKWVAYLELLGIISLLYVFEEPVLHFLFIIPFTNFVSSEAKKRDILLFLAVCSAYIFYKTDEVLLTIILSIGLLTTLYLFHQRFNLIERLQRELYNIKNEINEYRDEIQTQRLGFEITTKMFYHMRELSEAMNEKEVIQKMISGTKSFFNATYVCMYTRDEDGVLYEHVMEEGERKRYDVPMELTNAEKEPTFEDAMMRTMVEVNGQDWGVIAIYGKKMAIGEEGQMVISPFNESDFEVMLTYIHSVTKRIAELQISEQNHFLANNDSLTQVPNRRFFWERLAYMEGLAKRGQEFAVLVMDIDNFKSFNDTYGHGMGDSVLKIVAETIEGAIRQTDTVGRLGGEEFGVILHKPNGEAEMIADRIRKLVAAVPAVRQITVSIGLAYYTEEIQDIEQLMKFADDAMYQAKTTGKNKVVVYQNGMGMEGY